MTTIHHATAAKAERFGLKIQEDGTAFVVLKGSKKVAAAPTARTALQDAIDLLGLTLVEGGKASAPEPEKKETPAASGSIVKNKYRVIYGDKDNNGDRLASVLESLLAGDDGLNYPALQALGAENDIDVDARWASLNHGQKSMNLRNVLRGRMRRGEVVIVNGKAFS